MTKKIKVRNVERRHYADYLQKARELFKSAECAAEAGSWNAAAINAVHCAVSLLDALCVFKKQIRSASETHEDSIELLKDTDVPKDKLKSLEKKFMSIVKIKNMAAYEERLIKPGDGQRVFEHVKQVVNMVNDLIE